jgi:hypothetical protein
MVRSVGQAGPHPWLPSLLYLDRYRNEGTRSYSRHAAYTEAGPEYRPVSGKDRFELVAYEIPREHVRVHEANPPPALEELYVKRDTVVFCLHPQVLDQCAGDVYLDRTLRLGRSRNGIAVAPSSSTRTLYVVDEEVSRPHALKVHFPFRVSRYGRRMRDEVVQQAVAVSEELERWVGRGGDLTFLREVLGVAHPNVEPDAPRAEHWGDLVRDMVPFPAVESDRALVPGFALYGMDAFDPTRPPLIAQLADAADPLGWTLEHVLLPTIRQWIGCFRELGLVLEPHGQNTLLEVDESGAPTRIVHRDLSVAVDMRRRRDLGLGEGRLNGYNRTEDGAFNSIAYDKFMGGHFFERLAAAVLPACPAATLDDLARPCRDEFERLFPEHERYLPRSVHYFAERRDRFGKPHVEDTGALPPWRP